MTFKAVFVSIFIGTSLIVAALIINAKRPAGETLGPTPDFVRASGKCAECHSHETSAVVHQFERSKHASSNVNCLDCHRALEGQEPLDHRGFTIAKKLTAKNCAECHATEYNQFLKSRHAAPAWAAVHGDEPFTPEQIAHSEMFHKGMVSRPPNALALNEGPAAFDKGCDGCHSVGRPNADGSIGTCTACHARHSTSIALAREPQTCGQCHMGPDHSQIEIYTESKHGVLFHAQKASFNMSADPKKLSTRDMSVPTCATCHMSGLEGMKVSHDTTDRLSYFLYAAVSTKRPTFAQGQEEMKEVCLKCHTKPPIDEYYAQAEEVLEHVNNMVVEAQSIMKGLRDEGLLTPEPFDEPIEFLEFDYWHYWGRTAKHGAFMGGADFVQWHGNYELLAKLAELKEMAKVIRTEHNAAKHEEDS
ncbi:MAG TPA: multiheme c-type cytochrome [Phycisphaerae bacterium]|nr:multiheme c-type cytochrome [Phycisphaerae bacterium]